MRDTHRRERRIGARLDSRSTPRWPVSSRRPPTSCAAPPRPHSPNPLTPSSLTLKLARSPLAYLLPTHPLRPAHPPLPAR